MILMQHFAVMYAYSSNQKMEFSFHHLDNIMDKQIAQCWYGSIFWATL